MDVLHSQCTIDVFLRWDLLDNLLVLRRFGLLPHTSQEILEIVQHSIDLPLGIPGDLIDGIKLLLGLMPIEGQFMPVVVKTRTALRRIPRILYPRKHLLHIILNIPLDNIHLHYIFPTVIILNISYLRIFIFLLHQIIQMVCLHLFYDLHQSVVECCCQIHLSVVLLFEI